MAIWPLKTLGWPAAEEGVTITSAVWGSPDKGAPHTVFSCVVTRNAARSEALECRISLAPDLEQGAIQGCAQAMGLLDSLRASGEVVVGVHCSYCPTPREPVCGPLARPRHSVKRGAAP